MKASSLLSIHHFWGGYAILPSDANTVFKYIYIYIYIYTVLQKFGNALEKWGFGQYWHESFLICDNFALIRDNTNYENIFYYLNSLYIEKT